MIPDTTVFCSIWLLGTLVLEGTSTNLHYEETYLDVRFIDKTQRKIHSWREFSATSYVRSTGFFPLYGYREFLVDLQLIAIPV